MWLSESFDRAFHSIRSNYLTWLGLAAINAALGLPLVFGNPNESIINPSSPLFWTTLVAILLNIMITPGMLAMGLAGSRTKKVELAEITRKLPLFMKYLGFSVIYTVAIAFGTLALIIPGIYLAIRFGLAPFMLVEDESLGVFDALKKSGDRMKGNYLKVALNVFVLLLASMFIVMFFSIILFFVLDNSTTSGVLIQQALNVLPASIATPIIYVGFAVVYNEIMKKPVLKK